MHCIFFVDCKTYAVNILRLSPLFFSFLMNNESKKTWPMLNLCHFLYAYKRKTINSMIKYETLKENNTAFFVIGK